MVEVTPAGAAPAWSEAGAFAAAAWPAFAVAAQEPGPGKPERPLQAGVASWYGPGFHGRRTASGEVFNQNALTAAHRYLPFGTKVKVVDPKTGRSVIVRINDRGPFAHGRVIDLSKASAQALGIGGLARVQLVSSE
ncbi:septal ring lytic transglycosylase RlpA family protein [uncultured Enterovirga sp.]|uniref:septal ring lytic transglycosylase RlpA family protein n=1 Tax=uncultured Enterovirga sp. TaxID=2026352 RepID=UPI0035CA2F77